MTVRFWEENRKLLTGVGLALLTLPASWYVLVGRTARAEARVRAQYNASAEKLDGQRKGMYDVQEVTADLRASNAKIAEDIANLESSVQISFHPWTVIPGNYADDRGAYFRLTHAEEQTRLTFVCQQKDPPVRVRDYSFGFKRILEGDIDAAAAQVNLNRLSVVEHLVVLLAESGVAEISAISPGDPAPTGAAGYPDFILEYPFSITVRTRLDNLMKFLHAVRSPGRLFLTVRALSIAAADPYSGGRGQSLDDQELSVTIDAAGMRFVSQEERQSPAPTTGPAGKTGGRVKASGPRGD